MSSGLTEPEVNCLRSVQQAADALGVPIVAVGANARRLAFDIPNGITLHRITTDWDFGVRVPDWNVFRQLRERLLEQHYGFSPGMQEHQLTHEATGIRIDVVPFGGLENDGRIYWPDSGFAMNVLGFSEAFENATEIEISPGFHIAVATVQLQVALKFFAHADRKQETDRDLSDLWHVIRNYSASGRETELFDSPLSSLVNDGFDWEYAGSLLLGRDVSRACKPSTVARLLPILAGLTDAYSPDLDKLISGWPSSKQEDEERRRVSSSFLWLLRGLQLPR
jgi:predicted nucleotidyltransferase